MPYSWKQITAPAHEPIALSEVKDFLRVDTSDQDGVITRLVKSARFDVEAYLNRCLVTQQWQLGFDRTPGSWPFSYGFGASLLSPYREITIPRSPVVSIDEFTYVDMATGNPVAMSEGTDYQVSTAAEPARLQPAYGQAWPIARWSLESLKITATIGYGDPLASPATGTIPEPFITAILLTVGHYYENRESQEIPPAAKNLLTPHRVFSFAPVMNNWERWAR